MSHRQRVLVFALAGALLTFVAFCVSTQYVASALGHQPQLGPPALTLGGLRVYTPWSWVAWDTDFEVYAARIFFVAKAISYGAALLAFAPLVGLALVASQRASTSDAHGSARWATARELKASGMLSDSGVVLCQTSDARYSNQPGPTGSPVWRLHRHGRLLTHGGPEHVICFAPTRSGKGVGTVVPTLLSWSGSVLVYDIKKELWTLTAGWRRKFSRCWRFEPTAPDSVRFNPLLEVRKGDNEVRDVQNVADILVDPDGSEKKDHWKTSAHALLVGTILHVLYAGKNKTLTGVARLLSDPERPLFETLNQMLVTHHLPSGPHPLIAQCAREMLDKSENELAGIVSTAKTCVNLYNDPLIARNTETSDFRIVDLMQAADPVSLYLVVPPSDLDRTRPLVRLLLNQIGRRLTERMEFGDKPAYRHRLLMLLDEFPSLGKLTFLETQLAFLAGYGIKAFLVAQSLNQLEAAYGQHHAILDNCHVRLTYTALDDRTAKRISDLLGQQTHVKRQRSFSGGRSIFRNVSESEQEHARPLLTPDEILRLPYEDALLLVGGAAPYRAKKVMYFLDPRFRGRAKLPPPDSPRRQRAELFENRSPSDWEVMTHLASEPSLSSPEPSSHATTAPESESSHANSHANPVESSHANIDPPKEPGSHANLDAESSSQISGSEPGPHWSAFFGVADNEPPPPVAPSEPADEPEDLPL